MLRRWIGLALVLLLNIGSSLAETPVKLEFADTNPRGGMVAGIVRIEVLEELPGVVGKARLAPAAGRREGWLYHAAPSGRKRSRPNRLA